MGCVQLKESEHKERKKSEHRSSVQAMIGVNKGNIREDYEFVKTIGEGGFGHVREVREKSTNLCRACKTIHVKNMNPNHVEKILEEVNILKQLDHPGVITIYDVYQEIGYLHIVTELCTGGDLFERITERKYFSENVAAKYMHDIVSTVKFCHEAGVVHRDLKPENILFEDKTPGARLKIIDFGTSTKIQTFRKMKTLLGTPFYIAPEVLDGTYNEKCDVWSLGVIMYIMLCGKAPFNGNSYEEIFNNIKNSNLRFKGSVWSGVSKSAKNLLKRILNKNPEKRMSIGELLYDPWLTTRSKDQVPDRAIASKSIKQLVKFHTQNCLQLCTLAFLTHFFTKSQELKEVRGIFESLDTDQDGKLSKEEVAHGINFFCCDTEYKLDTVFKNCDIDKNGYIDFSEFLTAVLSLDLELSTKRLFKAFNALDKDGNGRISKVELQMALGDTNDDSIRELLKEVDLDGNGEIDRNEFVQAILKITNIG
ncbi:hypothetical protein SteCoe_15135 [Stentor coeruleus]|uniref:non-specific serine/threonine protein kinase n=1 Tax=Stentor coeruleus TaxID=5963 RepID=A0A1R2C4A0_9CILI|nr:hypothetical protein SteCoe_15135 [Stentor coeruleus]